LLVAEMAAAAAATAAVNVKTESSEPEPPSKKIGEEIEHTFKISLKDVKGPLIALNLDQQKEQRSPPFELFGMHWVITIERETPGNNTKNKRKRESESDSCSNIAVALWCLSVQIECPVRRKQLPLKGPIHIPDSSDHEPRTFNGREGRVCNLVGKSMPAVAMRFDSVSFSLRSGSINSGTKSVSAFLPDGFGDFFGGFYDETWRGCACIMLEDYKSDPLSEGHAIQVKMQFLEKTPCAVVYA
jgi:hypothetical protein